MWHIPSAPIPCAPMLGCATSLESSAMLLSRFFSRYRIDLIVVRHVILLIERNLQTIRWNICLPEQTMSFLSIGRSRRRIEMSGSAFLRSLRQCQQHRTKDWELQIKPESPSHHIFHPGFDAIINIRSFDHGLAAKACQIAEVLRSRHLSLLPGPTAKGLKTAPMA